VLSFVLVVPDHALGTEESRKSLRPDVPRADAVYSLQRTALLVRAHARARQELGRPLPLVLVGGAPGEWEGEHPADAAARSPCAG